MTANDLLEGLNPEQRDVATHNEGPLLVTAVAGCGKTTALVHRIAYLIEGHGVPQESINAVTFSKKAADEMNERLRKLGVTTAQVGTWHSLTWKILRRELIDSIGAWDVDDRDRYRTIVKVALGFRGMDWKTADLSVVLGYIGRCKARLAKDGTDKARQIAEETYDANPCQQTAPDLLFEAYELAEEARRQRRLITFDDMLVGAWELLLDENTRQRWASKWTHLLQDEAQDENEAQHTIGEILARDHRNYMIVGDPAQSIYGFRGAEPERFMAFAKDWGARTIAMRRNYRSGAEIIDASNGVIRAMAPETHMGVEMLCERGTRAEIAVTEHVDAEAEAEHIGDEIASLLEDGGSPSEVAVLYRTNSQSRAIEEAMLTRRIPYVVLGGTQFWNRKEVKALIGYLRVADGRADFDDMKKCLNTPFRYLGKRFVERVECEETGEPDFDWADAVVRLANDERNGLQGRQRTSAAEWANLIRTIRRSIEARDAIDLAELDFDANEDRQHPAKPHMPAALLEMVIRDTRFVHHLTRDEGAETVENNRVSNVRELVRVAEKFTTVRDFLDFIDENLEAAERARHEKRPERVILCSLHKSKGLEWPTVYIAGASEKLLPHSRADIEEERRLFYVGVTRAKDRLRVSHVGRAAIGPTTRPVQASQFIGEAGLEDTAPALGVAS